MLQSVYNDYNAVTASEGRADTVIDIETVMDRYGINLSAARVLKLIDRLVKASRQRGVKDKRGIPYCYASKEWIAGKIGKSARTVARAIRDLKAAGLIECKRTRANAMLFIAGYGIYGAAEPEQPPMSDVPSNLETQAPSTPSYASETAIRVTPGIDQNGTSKITTQSNNNRNTVSITLTLCPDRTRRDKSARLPQKGKASPTPAPSRYAPAGSVRGAAARERFEAERRRISSQLERQLFSTGLCYADAIDSDTDSAIQLTVKTIADAVAAKQDVRVNGVTMPADQYWDVVRHVKATQLDETIRAIAARECLGLIRNKRAYLLSSVYNCALWGRFNEVKPNMRELESLAGGMLGRAVMA